MPYIPRDRQDQLDPFIEQLIEQIPIRGYGDLEYVFFSILREYSSGEHRRFEQMNALVGVLETTKAEYLARIVTPYESLKLIDSWAEDSSED